MHRHRIVLVAALIAACGPSYDPPAWLVGDWTTETASNDTSWFEWSFGPDRVIRRDIHGRELDDEVDYSEIGYREQLNDDEVYVLRNFLGEDGFLRTDDADRVMWGVDGDWVLFPGASPMQRMAVPE